eukprot:COSAG05_NODE_74_length_21769_cov_194.316290_27_plen_101_part_00
MRGCVVRVAGVWVSGEYSEYGWVQCAREGQGDPEHVWLEQFKCHFEGWGVPEGAVLGTVGLLRGPAAQLRASEAAGPTGTTSRASNARGAQRVDPAPYTH